MYWDISWKKTNGASVTLPENKIPNIKSVLEKGLRQCNNQSRFEEFELDEIRFERHEEGSKFIVTLTFSVENEENIEETRRIVESWINSCLQNESDVRVNLYFDR